MAWWPEDQWRRMCDSDECGMCADAPLATNPFGLSMGSRMPHVDCHVLPQYQHDDPFSLLNPQDGDVRSPEAQWADRVQTVRAAFVAAVSG